MENLLLDALPLQPQDIKRAPILTLCIAMLSPDISMPKTLLIPEYIHDNKEYNGAYISSEIIICTNKRVVLNQK